MSSIETARFLHADQVAAVAKVFGTPTFVYSQTELERAARALCAFPAPYGLTPRYAMKANPARRILDIFRAQGIGIDASSGYEVHRAMRAGYAANEILLTTQELPADFFELAQLGVQFDACSLWQLEQWGKALPGSQLGVRINPGIGSGHSNKTNVGGPSSSFGIWHEYTDQISEIAGRYKLQIVRLHTHIGAGTDPAMWERAAHLSLQHVRAFPAVHTLNLGGGFKVGRLHDEASTDLARVGQTVSRALEDFAAATSRRLQLELEPGTFLVANAGTLVTTIQDMTDTGETGYQFLKLDGGMTDILRPALYGAQQPLVVVNDRPHHVEEYVVVGHCCESGDLLTPAPGNSEQLAPRRLQRAERGDHLLIEGVGAYCATMNAHGYNSFPAAAEILLTTDGQFEQICRRQMLNELIENENVKDKAASIHS